MPHAVIIYLLCSQASLFMGLFLCVLLKPKYVLGSNQGGVSNFATDRQTILPFTLALLLDAIFTLLASRQLREARSTYSLLINMLLGLAVWLVVVLLSSYSYKQSNFLHRLHFLCGIILVSFEAVLGILLLIYMRRDVLAYLAIIVQYIGDIICILSLRNIVQRLFLGQVIASIGFAILLCSVPFVI